MYSSSGQFIILLYHEFKSSERFRLSFKLLAYKRKKRPMSPNFKLASVWMAMAFQSFQALLSAPQCLKKLKLLDSKDAHHIRNLSIGTSAAAGARSELFELVRVERTDGEYVDFLSVVP
jgi:hypothetical protein